MGSDPVFTIDEYSIYSAHARERPARDHPRGSPAADGGGESLVSRRIEERASGAHRVRAPLRASDVRRLAALRQGLLPSAAGSRRGAERIDESRSHQLLGGRSHERARPGAVDGIRSDGLSVAGPHDAEIRDAARGGAERAAPELREQAVRALVDGDRQGVVSVEPSLSLADDRGNRRSEGRHVRRRAGVFQHVLPSVECVAGRRRRCRYGRRARARPAAFRRDSCRTEAGAARFGGRDHGRATASPRGSRRAAAPVSLVALARDVHRRRCRDGSRVGFVCERQSLAALQGARVRAAHRQRSDGVSELARARRASGRSWPRRRPATRSSSCSRG